MSSHKSTQKRRWISLLILVQLISMVLPVHVVSAADQQVVIPKEVVSAMVFQAIWQQALDDVKVEEVPALQGDFSVQEEYVPPSIKRGEVLPPEAAVLNELVIAGASQAIINIEYWEKYLRTIAPGEDYAFRGKKSYEEIIFTMLNVASEIPEMRPFVKTVWQTLSKWSLGPRNGRMFLRNVHIVQAAQKYGKAQALRTRAPQVMQQVIQSAQSNPEVAIVFDVLWSDEIGMNISDYDVNDYIREHPDGVIPPAIVERMREDGSVSISLNDLKELALEHFGEIHVDMNDLRRKLFEIDGKQDQLIDYINNQQERERLQAEAAAKAAEHQLKLQAAHSSLFIVYTLADVIDPEFATQLNVVGGSVLQVYESMNGWMKAVAGLGTLEKFGSLSTVVMTGNVLGAVMNVVSLFGDSGPTMDQMILEEIGKLRQQVNKLRTEMHSRFDRIDEELNTIYSTMQSRFDLIDIQLGRLNGKIDEVQKTLIGLDLKLSRMERNNFEFLDALGRRPLLDAINGGLGYEERTGLPMLYQPDFVNFENELHSWGTIHAYDALNAGPTQRDYAPSEVMDELSAYPLDSNINYLNGWLMANGLPGFTNKRLASPRDWLFATRAYTELGIEWPEHVARIDPQRLASMEAVGVELEEAMLRISTLETVSGTVGNALLFSQVITNYTSKLDTLGHEIEKQEIAFTKEVVDSLHPGLPINLYGGANQQLTYNSPEMSMMTCGDSNVHGEYPATNNLKSLIPNFNVYNLAEYLGLGKFSACLSDEWTDTFEHCDIDFEPPFERNCFMKGAWKGTLTVYFGDVAIMTQSGTAAEETVSENYLKDHWVINGYKQWFEEMAGADQPTPEENAQRAAHLATVTTQVENRLAFYQQELYKRVRDAMTGGALNPFAVELAGGKALLDSYVTLGLSRAVAEDELLHAMLYGNQQLVEDSQIVQSYHLSATQPIAGAALLINPRTLIWQAAEQRMEVFGGLINQYLDAITAQTYIESPDYVANSRRDLELTMTISQIMEEPPVTPEPPATPETPGTPEIPGTPGTPGTPETPVPPVTPVPPGQPGKPDEPLADDKRIYLPAVVN